MSSNGTVETARQCLIQEPYLSPARVPGDANRLILRVEHQELHQTAVQANRHEVTQRALSAQNAWLEVARVLRLEMSQGER